MSDEKEIFVEAFYELVDTIVLEYGKAKEQARDIAGYMINKGLATAINDASSFAWLEYYDKYLHGSGFLWKEDFTISELREIIAETPLTERDRHIAIYTIIDEMTEDAIADKLQIDKKTVHSNIIKIRLELRKTAVKLRNKAV